MKNLDYPDPTALRTKAAQLLSTQDAVSDASEYPSLARMSVRRQAEAAQNLAQAIEDNATAATAPKRVGMTGEERRTRRAAILRIRAARLEAKAADLHRHSHDIGSRIPLGQPILVGHHSERGHRRAIDRMHNADSKAFAASQYAESLDRRANSVENSDAIMAGDSDAVVQINTKLADLERKRDLMRLVNKAHAAFKKDPASLASFDLPEHARERIRNYVPAYSWEPHPVAPFQLTNIGAEIRRLKQRLETLARDKALPDSSCDGEHAQIEDSPADNRVRLFFPGKPSEDIRGQLKRAGFRWSPSIGAWQAYRHPHTIEAARKFAGAQS